MEARKSGWGNWPTSSKKSNIANSARTASRMRSPPSPVSSSNWASLTSPSSRHRRRLESVKALPWPRACVAKCSGEHVDSEQDESAHGQQQVQVHQPAWHQALPLLEGVRVRR